MTRATTIVHEQIGVAIPANVLARADKMIKWRGECRVSSGGR
jgi:hypothetical protein